MSDTSQGPGWWQADNGQWYPAEARADFNVWRYGAATQPGPKWWMADDGRWYPPRPREPRGRFSRGWRSMKPWQQVTSIMLVFTVVVGGCTAMARLAPPHRTNAEKVFLDKALNSGPLKDQTLLDVGHAICGALRDGTSDKSVRKVFVPIYHIEYQYDIITEAATSSGSLCPDQRSKVVGSG